MNSGIGQLSKRCALPADAIRWACLLEATAPKVGNVCPDRSFEDLSYTDFVLAGELTASAFEKQPKCFSRAILDAANRIADRIGTNVNLGILLLLGPLVQAENTLGLPLESSVKGVLSRLTAQDAQHIYQAINLAAAGGMGRVNEMDVRDRPPDDLIHAMRTAATRDRIARNYANGFDDLFGNVIPVVRSCLGDASDLLQGIVHAQIRLLAEEPDTLIARKFGDEVAKDVSVRARIDPNDAEAVQSLDRFLRGDNPYGLPRINPGTTADLIAAALYVLLRESG